MKKLIGGNFKMNLHTTEEIDAYMANFIKDIDTESVDVVLAPQLPLLSYTQTKLENTGALLGAQDMRYEEKGAFTGQTSPVCLQNIGVKYVIIGHGERRNFAHETNDTINKKIASAIAHGMRPIFCIGESLEQKEQGLTESILKAQISEGLEGIAHDHIDVAYEPLWAIGTGLTPSNEDIQNIHTYIRSLVGIDARILYGGSVNETNAESIAQLANVDGFLVGGASLDPIKFGTIIQACY